MRLSGKSMSYGRAKVQDLWMRIGILQMLRVSLHLQHLTGYMPMPEALPLAIQRGEQTSQDVELPRKPLSVLFSLCLLFGILRQKHAQTSSEQHSRSGRIAAISTTVRISEDQIARWHRQAAPEALRRSDEDRLECSTPCV